MRLTQIKLSGFKSFVDPTAFLVPGQLVGVVGPNGCGKSNIIDATRWVLGESKASELRGESMQDVIFNGSMHRKPAGRASVELVFDNNIEHGVKPAAGQWSQYAEISVKRVLTRDGNSTYYINNQAVRRRDIQDIFLGTGLGPRAYAIIGQGMISRIIEAKPDDLRIFLEEAAGVSKYKERRRETENRLQDTRENLTRLEDILRELSSNLERLESQAAVAARYQSLQASADEKQKLLWLLRRREAEAEQQKLQRDVEKAQIALDAQTADLRSVESHLETLRQSHYAATDAVNEAQNQLYQIQTEAMRLESDIRFVVESRTRLTQQLALLDQQATQWRDQAEQFDLQLEQASGSREDLEIQSAEAQERLELATTDLPRLEDHARDGQTRVNDLRAEVMTARQGLEIEAATQRSMSTLLQSLAARRERLSQEGRGLHQPDGERLAMQSEALETLEAKLEDLRAALEQAQTDTPVSEAARQTARQNADRETSALQHLEARLGALKQLQDQVAHQGKLAPWLEKHGLASLPRLWQQLTIERGWEPALESALRERVAAIEVGQLDRAKAFADDTPPAKLSFFTAQAAASAAAHHSAAGLRPLISLLKFNEPNTQALLTEWLTHFFIADSIDQALAQRESLPPGGYFVVQSGHLIGRVSIGFHAGDDEQAGMLARRQEIENLDKQIKAQGFLAEQARNELVKSEAALSQLNAQAHELRNQIAQTTRDVHQIQLEVQKLSQAQQQFEARSRQIDEELAELSAQHEEHQAALEESQQRFETLDARLGEVQTRHEDEQTEQISREQQVAAARAAMRDCERKAQEAEFAIRNQHARIDELKRSIAMAQQQLQAIAPQREAQQQELGTLDDAAAQAGLQQALAAKFDAEAKLAEARNQLEALTAQMRAADESRLTIERNLEPARNRIVELQLKEQAARMNQEQFAQQLADAQADEASLGAKLDADNSIRPAALQTEINRLQQDIVALGAVNLAALDELTAALERKTYLDAQQTDLVDAITTLEDAIRKIDGETRALLKETFDNVNHHFGRLFPELFGGGEAKLMMTGDEILDAGVQVMAQPPGKRNSTIHLLSGGEKALTAIALVFAIFQLNPAPFCLLDEVDAPLDDANTDRFCAMVKKMSAVTQFLFISHNKVAMEMAEQLIGVTMQEQGVSRIVAVDIESATQMVGETERAVA